MVKNFATPRNTAFNPKAILLTKAILLSGIILSGCASNPAATIAIQRENNQYEVTGIGKSKTLALHHAVNAANKTCRPASAIVTQQQVNYQGIGSEQTGKIIEQAASVIGVLTGGKTAEVSRDDDYEATLQFYCKAN